MESAPSSALAICVALPKNVNVLSLVAASSAPGRLADLAFRQIGPQMEAENAVDVVFLEHPRFADELRATGGFLGGLEYDEHAALKFVEVRGNMAREAERHGHVPVVAACVHVPGMRGAERHA